MARLSVFKFSLAALLATAVTTVGVAQSNPTEPEIPPLPREKAQNDARSERRISLAECVAIALEEGNLDNKVLLGPAKAANTIEINRQGRYTTTRNSLHQRAELDIGINYLLANVEVSYWKLFAAYHNMCAYEDALHRATPLIDSPLIGDKDARDQARAQVERSRRMVAGARVAFQESEPQLRCLLGLRSDDVVRLVPSDDPSLSFKTPDFQAAAFDALAHRPEVLQCRLDLKTQQLKLALLKNSDALDEVKAAESKVKLSFSQMRDTELKVLEFLVQQYRQVIQTHSDIAPAREERKALETYLKKMDLLIAKGKWNPGDFLNYLTVQQQLATAIATEYQAIANFKSAQATFEFAKGTIQQSDSVTGEIPMPAKDTPSPSLKNSSAPYPVEPHR